MLRNGKNEKELPPPPAIDVPECSGRVLWCEAKKKPDGFGHIHISLSGKKDTATCTICNTEKDLNQPGRKLESVLLELSRKHYYKHKLDRN